MLGAVAEMAARAGIGLAGTIRPLDPDRPAERCGIVLALLPDGERRDISLALGPGATGCRLDAGALEQATLVVLERLPAARGLIVNRFGKQEATGRGLVGAIGEACARELPVLVGVSPQWREAFLAFTGDDAQEIAADAGLAFAWLREQSRPAAA